MKTRMIFLLVLVGVLFFTGLSKADEASEFAKFGREPSEWVKFGTAKPKYMGEQPQPVYFDKGNLFC